MNKVTKVVSKIVFDMFYGGEVPEIHELHAIVETIAKTKEYRMDKTEIRETVQSVWWRLQ